MNEPEDVRGVLKSMLELLILDPVREGRLRLAGLSFPVYWASVVGVTSVIGLLGSVLSIDAWRQRPLVPVGALQGIRSAFVPSPIIPLTMVAFSIAWCLLVWGVLRAGRPFRVGGSVLFVVINNTLARPLSYSSIESKVLSNAATGVYVALGALLLVSALRREWPTFLRRAFVSLGCFLVLLFFGGHLALYIADRLSSTPSSLPQLLQGEILNIQNITIPLAIIAAASLVLFAEDLAKAASVPFLTLNSKIASWALLALIAVKLWFQVFSNVVGWMRQTMDPPSDLLITLISLATLVGFALIIDGSARREENDDEDPEGLIRAAALVFSVPALLGELVLGVQLLLISVSSEEGASWVSGLISEEILTIAFPVAVWLVALAVGLWKWKSQRSPGGIWTGLLLISAWIAPFQVARAFGYSPHLDVSLMDTAVTVGAILFLLLRRNKMTGGTIASLGALVLFSWLVQTRGDFIGIVGSWLHLPGEIVFVFGVLFSLISGCAFTMKQSTGFSRESRTLTWLGFMILSLTIVNWISASRVSNIQDQFQLAGFFFVAIPFAVWSVVSQPLKVEPQQRA